MKMDKSLLALVIRFLHQSSLRRFKRHRDEPEIEKIFGYLDWMDAVLLSAKFVHNEMMKRHDNFI